MSLTDITRYELPPEGTTLLGYIVRRMHKTEILSPVSRLIAESNYEAALRQIASYTAAAAVSYGPAYYQPDFNAVGEKVSEPDPATGFNVTARLEERSPDYHITCIVRIPNGELFIGEEMITGTTVRLTGLGMPAPSWYQFISPGGYRATITGTVTSELAPSLLGPWRIRAYGSLEASDNFGNKLLVRIDRSGDMKIESRQGDDLQVEKVSLMGLRWLEQVQAV